MHSVAVLALDRVLAFDLSTPIEVFGRTRLPDGRAAYRVRVCARSDEVDAGAFLLRASYGLDALAEADTIILPGIADPTMPVPEEVVEALLGAAANGTRIASICVGAFILPPQGSWTAFAPPPTGPRPQNSPAAIPRSTLIRMCCSSITATC